MAPRRPWSYNIDMYRRVPADLVEGTAQGSWFSILALVTMTTLFLLETKAFFTTSLVTEMTLDNTKQDEFIRLNFDITMMDMKCEYVTIDMFSSLGTEQNVTKNLMKREVDAEGVRRFYHDRNKKQHDIVIKDETVTASLEELHEDGEDAISLDPRTLDFAKSSQKYLFVDFYASWCSHCQALAPTWETLAEVMEATAEHLTKEKIKEYNLNFSDEDFAEAEKVDKPVMIAKVDCVEYSNLCQEENIRAYPTIRLFVDGDRYADYMGHRTVVEFVHWLGTAEQYTDQSKTTGGAEKEGDSTMDKAKEIARKKTIQTEEQHAWAEKIEKQRRHLGPNHHAPWNDKDHPGCQISGYLTTYRAPGNFRIQAQSKHQHFNPQMTNVSHEVHSLYLGTPRSYALISSGTLHAPPNFLEKIKPMDGNVYVTQKFHEGHHHYLKIITTEFKARSSVLYAYQVLVNSQLSMYATDTVPEAKFTYDVSPVAVSFKEEKRPWYDYITSIMAILGGTFTVVGMMEMGARAISSKKFN